MHPIAVQKYGGSSVADVEKIGKVAERVIKTKEAGFCVVVVVSAMGQTTDDLLTKAKQIAPSPPKRELDMLLTVGERISMSLLTMAIQDRGHNALSLTGSQCGIITNDSHSNAKIIDVRPVRIQDALEQGSIVIVAGYQGMSYKREITTLGRGGSDTTAVALAASLGAKYCEICSDIDGVYTADPRLVADAKRIDEIDYDEMETLASAGAKILTPDAIQFARQKGLDVYLTDSFKDGTGTLLLKTTKAASLSPIRSIAHRKQLILLHFHYENDEAISAFFELLDRNQTPLLSAKVESGVLQCILDAEQAPDWPNLRKSLAMQCKDALGVFEHFGSVSLVGTSLSAKPGIVGEATNVLKTMEIEWRFFQLERNELLFILDSTKIDRALIALHRRFFDDFKEK